MKRKIMNKMKNTHIKILLTIIFLIAYSIPLSATIRYVSHTGSSTPPYTTWETAADSIQKCIDYSVDGDTIIVANGVYYESLIINKYLWLFGSSMDSTVIDGTGLAGTTVYAQADFNIEGFTIIGKIRASSNYIIGNLYYNVNVKDCRMFNAGSCIAFGKSSGKIENVILSNCEIGLRTFCYPDPCNPEISNSVIIMENSGEAAINIFDGGSLTITDNVIIGDNSNTGYGINVVFSVETMIIKNNIITGFPFNIDSRFTTGMATIENNVTAYQYSSTSPGAAISAGSTSNIINNIIAHNNRRGIQGDVGVPVSDYNLFWNNAINTSGGVTTDSTDVLGDPMLLDDTIPTYGGNYDFHLQAYSPAIDRGDPNILDVNGSRSDIGAYGGPGGESYIYLDLPPIPPVNLNADVEDSLIILTWNRNSEADTAYYNVYRDTVQNFTIDSTKLIGSPADTFYTEPIPKGTQKIYYKITAVDNQKNESGPSEEAVIILTVGLDEPKVNNNYALYQNYPNPFNPSTRIGYKLIERCYVKMMVYDITGSLVSVLVNEVQETGYHEVEFNTGVNNGPVRRNFSVGGLASGIYLYRIEVIGEGNIPRFSDMKKMILIK